MPGDVLTAMGFSARVRTAFAKAQPPITVIGDIIAMTPTQMLNVRGISPVSLHEIETILAMHKLALAPREIGSADHG